jgi:hypothetical protein
VRAGARVEGVRIVLDDAGSIDGRVVDARGYGVARLAVETRSERDPTPLMVITEPDGTFRVDGVVGRVTLTAWPSGEPGARVVVDVTAGATAEATIALDGALVTVDGRVVDDHGYGVGGARVDVESLSPEHPVERSVMSEPDGTFSVAGLPAPPFRVTAEHEGYASPAPLAVAAVGRPVEITLRSGAGVAGEVRDATDGAALRGASVSLAGPLRTLETSTDAAGRFAFTRVAAGRYTLAVRAAAHLGAEQVVALVEGARGLPDVTLDPITLEAAASIVGVVIDARGDAVPDADVAAGAPPDWARAVRTDPQGRYRIGGLVRGAFAVTARHPAAGRGEAPFPVHTRPGEDAEARDVRLDGQLDDPPALGEGRLSGAAVVVDARAPRVVRVIGPGARDAGLAAGDRIESIDGVPCGTGESARDALRGPAGIEAIVQIRRGRHRMALRVPREIYYAPSDLPARDERREE